MQSAPQPSKRHDEAPHSAEILPFPLRALRDEKGGANDNRAAPEVSITPLPSAKRRKSKKNSEPELSTAERPSLEPLRIREWLKQAAIAAVILHLVAFAALQVQFSNDLERAAANASANADGTVTLDVEIVADKMLPVAPKKTNMTAPDAKTFTDTTPQVEQQKQQAQPKAPPAPKEGPVFALPQEQSAPPQKKAEEAKEAQSPNQEKVEEQKPEPVVQKKKTADPKKNQAKAPPSAAASPNRAAPNQPRQGVGGTANASSYHAQVLAHLQRFRTYPPGARERGITGVSTVTFTLSASGAVISASLSGSSGQGILDQTALAIVRRASPFPPIPPGLGRSSMTFAAPLRFNLR
ncbi:MAG TPA: energy transducer TonB [Xanthobacteraceae bacterium]|nr:energy transducer TonB [Xanthobacteraceae bacterium]